MDVHADLEALKAWVRDLFQHSGIHHSLPKPPIDLTAKEDSHEAV